MTFSLERASFETRTSGFCGNRGSESASPRSAPNGVMAILLGRALRIRWISGLLLVGPYGI